MQADFLLQAGSYIALHRLQNMSDEGETLCQMSECPQISGVERLSCKSLFNYCQRIHVSKYMDGYGLLVWFQACDAINFEDRKFLLSKVPSLRVLV